MIKFGERTGHQSDTIELRIPTSICFFSNSFGLLAY